ncbi:MAG: DUF721 domain-containing protein [Candidatus Dormibacteraeota bacterium]|nr:DUF721 domain-containing protein [Candidatus Dormibacteraeota bacterium]
MPASRSRKRGHGFEGLGDILPRVLARQPDAARLMEVRIQIAFRAVLGEELSAQCEEVTVQGSTVWVTTANPALAHQLRLDQETFVRRLNEQSGLPRRVYRLRVQTGRGRRGRP